MKKISIFMMVLGALLMMPVASAQAGLVALWHLDGNANDSSVNDNDGTVNGGAYYDDGMFDGALSFDGTDDYVEVIDNSSLDINGDLTIEAWVKFDSYPCPHSFIVSKDAVGQRSYALYVDGGYYGKTGQVGLVVFSSASYSIHWGDTVLITGQWYHIAGTYDFIGDGTSVMQIYVDGSPDSTAKIDAVGPIYSGSANLQIGARQYTGWRNFLDGTIDEVRIWDEALSADDIADSASLGNIVISKELTDPDPLIVGDTNGNGIDEVPMGTVITFDMKVTVENWSNVPLASVKVKDPLPAELELLALTVDVGTVESYTKGKSEKVFIEWDLSSVGINGSGILEIIAQTDENPAGHQEYTSPGIYELNGGAALSFCVFIADEEICLDMNSDALIIEAVGEDD